jgi:excisionase family DNA binding protein
MMRPNPRVGRQNPNGRASERRHCAKVQLRYDRTVDALAIEFAPDARSARTVRVAPGVNVDFDVWERLVCIEVLDASTRIPLSSLESLPSAADWLTLEEAAAESGLAPSTLRVQINNGRLAATKRGRDWLVDATALLNYLESRDTRGRPPTRRSQKRRAIARARRRHTA